VRLYPTGVPGVARKGGLSYAEFLRARPRRSLPDCNPLTGNQAEESDRDEMSCACSWVSRVFWPLYFYTCDCILLSMNIHKLSGHGRHPMAQDAGQASSCKDSYYRAMHTGIFLAGDVTIVQRHRPYGNALSNCGMQERYTTGTRRAAVLRPALHAYAGRPAARRCGGRTALGNAPQERQREIMKFITENGECLARVRDQRPAPDG